MVVRWVQSPELRNNHDIVMEAVKQDGGALEFASPKLRNNHELFRMEYLVRC